MEGRRNVVAPRKKAKLLPRNKISKYPKAIPESPATIGRRLASRRKTAYMAETVQRSRGGKTAS